MTLYPATTNIGKFAEFAAAAQAEGVDIAKLPGIDEMPDPIEDASTFMGNAEIKARTYSILAPGFLIVADDSGLEADALGGDPGVRSARFADDLNFDHTAGCKDTRNNLCLLSLLAAIPDASRAARFVCALALARNGEILIRAEGTVEGLLLDTPRGTDGFGYDPLFLLPSVGLTMAELPRHQKWELSHRGRAFRSLITQLSHSNL
jgi:XTP/dITP diphosphohydrolase